MMNAIRLKTEYLTDPIGIDIPRPRLFWNCEGGSAQTAYHIRASCDGAAVWDTGKVASPRMAGIPWAGEPLASRDSVTWRVRLWDETDAPGEWRGAHFEMGLLQPEDWQATWITGDYSPKKKERYPVDCFRRRFTCGSAERARLYITACGLYEARLNGARVGSFVMAPGFTGYDKRLYYQTYDVTAMLREGENTLEVELADGWFRGSVGAMGVRNVYGRATKLLAQLETTQRDGTVQRVITDGQWQWSNDGPLRFADMKDGEVADLRSTPAYTGHARVSHHAVTPTAANNVPVTEHERFTPSLSRTPSGKQLLDFGQNIAGYVEVMVNARTGQKLVMQFAEHLDAAGEPDMASIQCRACKPSATPKQEIALICKDGENRYKSKFAVFGFRYAAVEADIELTEGSVVAIAVYSDMEQTGFFECSDPLINRFVENTLWSMKGNFLDVPTDCPTRERAPWTGDVQIFAKTGSYLMDTAAFFRKWLHDLWDRQGKDGKVPCHAPDVRNNEYFPGYDAIARMDGCCGWADVAVLLPLCLYETYRDEAFLREAYPGMRGHTLYQISRTNRTGLFGKGFPQPDKKYISNVGQAFGEWLEPQDVYQQSVVQDFIAPHPEEATAYLCHICGIMMRVAEQLGHHADIPLYREYHEGCKRAYISQFTPVDTDRQSKLVRPLAFGILEGDAAEETMRRLVSAIEKRGYRIGTGFLSTSLILPLLSRMGQLDVAYKMMENRQQPGWLHEVLAGATTVWENWDGSASHNHYSPGSACQWLFETVCGVRVEGGNHFSIRPQPGGTLTRASFTFKSIFGTVTSAWEKGGGHTVYSITVPPGTAATVQLPGEPEQSVAAGSHSFRVG